MAVDVFHLSNLKEPNLYDFVSILRIGVAKAIVNRGSEGKDE